MLKRYKIINHITHGHWLDNAPLLLSAHALIKDTVADTVSVQCKFANLCKAEISAAYISITCASVDGESVEGVEQYVYLDLKTLTGELFGDNKLIALPNKNTRKITIALDKVIFSDGSVWKTDKKEFSPLPAPIPLSMLGHLEEQYRRAVPHSVQNNLPEQHDDYWRCGCGQINLAQTERCIKCKHYIGNQIASIDVDMLEQQLAKYAERSAEAARVAEEKQRKESERREAIRLKREKILKITLLSATAAIAILLVVILWAIPNRNFNQGLNALAMANVELAGEKFDLSHRAGRNSDRAINAYYEQANAFFEAGKFAEAYLIYNEISQYRNVTERMEYIYLESSYQIALQNLTLATEQSLLDAKEFFEAFPDYRDSYLWLKESRYGLGRLYIQRGISQIHNLHMQRDSFRMAIYMLEGLTISDSEKMLVYAQASYMLSSFRNPNQFSPNNNMATRADIVMVQEMFDSIAGFLDSDEQSQICIDALRMHGRWNLVSRNRYFDILIEPVIEYIEIDYFGREIRFHLLYSTWISHNAITLISSERFWIDGGDVFELSESYLTRTRQAISITEIYVPAW